MHPYQCTQRRDTGTRIFASDLSNEGYKASKAVFDVLAPKTPGTSESISAYPALYEIRMTTAYCVYIEVDFHDVPKMAKWIIENVVLIGEAIAEGICNHYGIKFIAPAVEQESDVIYRVQVGAFRNRENADNMLETLKKASFDGFIVKGNL